MRLDFLLIFAFIFQTAFSMNVLDFKTMVLFSAVGTVIQTGTYRLLNEACKKHTINTDHIYTLPLLGKIHIYPTETASRLATTLIVGLLENSNKQRLPWYSNYLLISLFLAQEIIRTKLNGIESIQSLLKKIAPYTFLESHTQSLPGYALYWLQWNIYLFSSGQGLFLLPSATI